MSKLLFDIIILSYLHIRSMNRLQVEQRAKSLVAQCIFINIEWIGKNIASSQIHYPHPKPDVGNLDPYFKLPRHRLLYS